jgi:hypothetical protein
VLDESCEIIVYRRKLKFEPSEGFITHPMISLLSDELGESGLIHPMSKKTSDEYDLFPQLHIVLLLWESKYQKKFNYKLLMGRYSVAFQDYIIRYYKWDAPTESIYIENHFWNIIIIIHVSQYI